MKNAVIKHNNSGISLITLIIMIVVMIILAGIVVYTQFNTVDNAAYAKFVQEFEEVRKSVETVRLGNTKVNIENIDNGFLKVYVSGEIPYSFLSISGSGEKQAYLVDLNLIGCDALTTGREYKKFMNLTEEERVINFGVDDVYVYDSRGRIYYARGVMNDGVLVHEGISAPKNNGKIRIVSKEQILNPERTKANIKVKIESEKEIESVFIGSKLANKIDGSENEYMIEVENNGPYDIVARDVEGNSAKDTIIVSGIGLDPNQKPTVTAEVKNSIREERKFLYYFGKSSKIKIRIKCKLALY